MMEGTASSEKRGNKKLELKEVEEGEDHISALPDSIIQHILSFLPSTKEAIRTSILSKRWKNQWSGVSSLIFDCTGMSDEQSLVFIDTTLIQHRCYNIEKFLIKLEGRIVDKDPLNEKIHFSIIRHVKELILEFLNCNIKLQQFLFNHTPLLKLRTLGCAIVPNEWINWECLKELNMINCMLPDDVVEGILSSCQLLELLGLSSCFGFSRLVVASNSLKEMELGNLPLSSVLEISCPKLEEFNLYGLLDVMTTSFKNLSSLIRAHLDFELEGEDHEGSLVKKVLEQFQHVEELTYGCQLFEAILSDLDGRPDLPPPLLKNKCLTLDSPEFGEVSDAIEYALLSSPFLEKIVITKDFFLEFVGYHNPFLMRHRERYWRRDGSEFKCLVSHLKFVEVIDLPDTDRDYPFVLDFIGFLLKNSTVLEKLVVTLKGGGKAFETEVSEFLQSFQRCLTHAIIEVLGSQSAQFV